MTLSEQELLFQAVVSLFWVYPLNGVVGALQICPSLDVSLPNENANQTEEVVTTCIESLFYRILYRKRPPLAAKPDLFPQNVVHANVMFHSHDMLVKLFLSKTTILSPPQSAMDTNPPAYPSCLITA